MSIKLSLFLIGSKKMAPSPRDEDDNTPKAPDKNEKAKCEKSNITENIKEKDKDEKVSWISVMLL